MTRTDLHSSMVRAVGRSVRTDLHVRLELNRVRRARTDLDAGRLCTETRTDLHMVTTRTDLHSATTRTELPTGAPLALGGHDCDPLAAVEHHP